MARQVPEEDFRDTEVRARVAVVSFAWDSATSVGLRTPPARETEITPPDAPLPVAGVAGVEVVGAGGVVVGAVAVGVPHAIADGLGVVPAVVVVTGAMTPPLPKVND